MHLPDLEDETQIGKFLARHFVSLSFAVFRPTLDLKKDLPNQGSPVFTSGCVMEIGAEWYWVTAGHVLADMMTAINDPQHELAGIQLIDCFGEGKHGHSVPFNIPEEWPYFEDHSGLDYGAFPIRLLMRTALQANGIEPVQWTSGTKGFDFYIIVGLAEQDIDKSVTFSAPELIIRGRPTPSMVIFKPSTDKSSKEFQQLVGRLNDDWPTDQSIKGMSGGPVFGIDLKKGQYEFVGLQSSWDMSKLRTYVCPVEAFYPRLLDAIKQKSVNPEFST